MYFEYNVLNVEVKACMFGRVNKWNCERYEFNITVKNTENGKSFETRFYTEECSIFDKSPDEEKKELPKEALKCIIYDAYDYDKYNNYVDFCNAMGYDVNNKESWKIFEGVKEENEKLNSIELSEDLILDILEIISE